MIAQKEMFERLIVNCSWTVLILGCLCVRIWMIIVIGNPLMSSPGFPPLHTVHATFTAHGVPSLVILTIYYNLPCSFLGVAFPEFLLNLLSGAERSACPVASY